MGPGGALDGLCTKNLTAWKASVRAKLKKLKNEERVSFQKLNKTNIRLNFSESNLNNQIRESLWIVSVDIVPSSLKVSHKSIQLK